MKNRLLCLVLTVFLIWMAVTISGCSTNKTNDNSISVNGSSVTTDKAKGKTNDEKIKIETQEQASQGESKENKVDNERNAITPSHDSVAQNTSNQAGKTTSTNDMVTLFITKDFGVQILVEKQVAINKNWTIIDLLASVSEIDTKWNGGFINSIDGLESNNGGMSGKRFDWFYYINGICSDVGAAEYDLKAGEVVWWDYHDWKSMGSTNSAVIGCYPEPFVRGYRGKIGATTVMSSADNQSLATDLQKALKVKGVRSVNVKELDNNVLENRQVPTIVIGTWNEVKQLSWLEKFNNAYRKTGTSVHFTDKGLELLDHSGAVAQMIDKSAGVIVAAGSGLGDTSPLWMLVGTDQEGLKQVVDILVNKPEEISRLYNAAVVSGKVIRLPLQ
ncbi:MAG: DUF4430 domain-containing protein [Syntrophomonadaceae bacterium]|nr:DUF4430 domain-containing protein [Syntrophomonadaceae bacterium]MDD4549537.1 DUF4430 domain-containing protein [Syntrophomonadaceae bacterium]